MTDTTTAVGNEYGATAQAAITLDAAGNGAVTIDGVPYAINGPDLIVGRDEAKRRIVQHAQASGQHIEVAVTEPEATVRLNVFPDGHISVAHERGAEPTSATYVEEPHPGEGEDINPPSRRGGAKREPITPPRSRPADPSPERATTDPALAEEEKRPATTGTRGALNRLGFSFPPGAAELEERRRLYEERREAEHAERAKASRIEARHRREEEDRRKLRAIIQKLFGRPVMVVVCNLKGGSGKTATTHGLGSTFGTIRGGGVIAWDANEAMGNLGDRSLEGAHQRTVVDLLEVADTQFASMEGSRLGLLDAFLRQQGDAHFDVLASDTDPARQLIVGEEEFKKIHEILGRYYRMILVDTGNNIRAAHFHAALDAADQLVIPVAVSRDSAKVAHRMMDAFEESGHGHLVRNAVAMLHHLKPEEEAGDEYLALRRSIAAELEPRVATVVPVPFDGHLEGGDRIDYAALQERTRNAYQEAAAVVAEGIAKAVGAPGVPAQPVGDQEGRQA